MTAHCSCWQLLRRRSKDRRRSEAISTDNYAVVSSRSDVGGGHGHASGSLMSTLVMLIATIAVVQAKGSGSRTKARLEPPDGRMIFAAWPDTTKYDNRRMDSVGQLNRRLGRKVGADTYTLPDLSVLDDGTDAAAIIPIYINYSNSNSQTALNDSIPLLVNQVVNLTSTGRPVFVQFMIRPTSNINAHVQILQNVTTAIRAKVGDKAATVWAPDSPDSVNYPELYPGDDYVDWVGIPVYFKGFQFTTSALCPPDFVESAIEFSVNKTCSIQAGQATTSAVTAVPSRTTTATAVPTLLDSACSEPIDSFYRLFAEVKGKPVMITEAGAGFPVQYKLNGSDWSPSPANVSQADMQLSFWNSFLFNITFLRRFPLVKLVVLNERIVQEANVIRDYRATYDRTTLSRFVERFDAFNTTFVWANATATATLPATVSADTSTEKASEGSGTGQGISATTAGGIAAGIVVAVIAGFILVLFLRRRRIPQSSKPTDPPPPKPIDQPPSLPPTRPSESTTVSRASLYTPPSSITQPTAPTTPSLDSSQPTFPTAVEEKSQLFRNLDAPPRPAGSPDAAKDAVLFGCVGEAGALEKGELGATTVEVEEPGREGGMEAWSAEMVSARMLSLGANPEAAAILRANRVDGRALLTLTRDDLHRLRVDPTHHLVLMRVVEFLKVLAQTESAGATAAGTAGSTSARRSVVGEEALPPPVYSERS
ncbi:hypothetical protein HDU96_009402 [Phlyctochytrium bullatum]|nr:hypothetical protein HDU96_009402 [Phlyctochytrium bullatum]